MNTDFAKLLNNCLNRMDGKDDDTDKNDDGRDTIGEKLKIFGTNSSSPVRSEIKDIIEEKIKQKDTNAGSPVLEKVGPIQLGGSDYDVELEESSGQATPEKAKILFSLKDFFERSKEMEKNADNLSSGEDQESDDASSDLDKNVESLYNDDQSPDGDNSDVISNDSDSDLETAEDSKSDNESDIEDKKGDEPDDDSDLESELNLLEKLKQKLDDSITGNPKDLDKDDSAVIVDGANKEKIKDVKKGDNESEKGKDELCTNTEKKDKLCEGSDNDPIKIYDDVAPKDIHEQRTKKDNQVKSMFKNISISLVGANSKTIDLESLLKKPSTNKSTSPPKQTPNVFQKPNISVKRKTVKSPELVLSGKRFKKSSIILSSDEDSPRKKAVPTVTLDENTTIEDISEDEKETKPNENVSSEHDNCTHGDPMDYMCVECTYNRWRCEWVLVKPVRVRKIKKVDAVEVNPVDIIQAINWEKVFKIAGVGVK